jgi:hypothetical protein
VIAGDGGHRKKVSVIGAISVSPAARRAAGPEADGHVERSFMGVDVNTMLSNNTEARRWCPDVRWPLLFEPVAAEVAVEFRRILLDRWAQDHFISAGRVGRVRPAARGVPGVRGGPVDVVDVIRRTHA